MMRLTHTNPIARLIAVAVTATMAAAGPALGQGEVNIYSYREPGLIDPLLKTFTDKTGIKVNVVFATAGLNERLAAEGVNTPADMLLSTDAARLTEAKQAGLTQAMATGPLDGVPVSYRDADGHWFGLTLRARVVYAHKGRVSQSDITYEELAEPKWKGRICSRSFQHAYNTALVATIIAHKGEAAADAWLRGVKANLARKPAGGDREQVRDVHAGLCDVALANTYYMAAMATNPEQKSWADSVKLLFPNAGDRGSHVNISGVALTKHAKNRDNAAKLVSFLLSEEGQRLYASINNEYPISSKVPPSKIVESWGILKPDPLPLDAIAKYRKRASELIDQVGIDRGP